MALAGSSVKKIMPTPPDYDPNHWIADNSYLTADVNIAFADGLILLPSQKIAFNAVVGLPYGYDQIPLTGI
jgi:hypothetical protein